MICGSATHAIRSLLYVGVHEAEKLHNDKNVHMTKRSGLRAVPLGLLMVMFLTLTVFASSSDGPSPLSVVTTIYPLREWAEAVGGPRVKASQLLPPGVEAHTYSPRPSDMVALRQADLFVYLHPAMEPWAKDLLAGIKRPRLRIIQAADAIADLHDEEHCESHDEHDHHGVDPHVWLDPLLAIRIVEEIAKVLADLDPEHKTEYIERSEEYIARLRSLHESISQKLADCDRRIVLFVGHSAFRYFGERYNLEFVTPYPGFSPNAAPGARAMATIAQTVRETGSEVIFHEELVVPRVAQAIANETGARLEVLHAVHNLTTEELQSGKTYLVIMEENAQKLQKALGCR